MCSQPQIAPVQSATRRITSATITVAALTAMVKAAGAAKLIAIAHVFGAGDALDAFVIAFLLPSFVGEVIGGSFTSALVPLFVSLRHKDSEAAAQSLFSATMALNLALVGAATSLVLLFRGPLLRLLASGFAPGKLALTESLLVWMFPVGILIGLSSIWRGILNACDRFALASAAPVMTPLITIALLAGPGRRWGAGVLVAGAVAGTVLELVLVAVALRRNGISIRPRWEGRTPQVRMVVSEYLPLVVGALLTSGALIIDAAMAARLGPGSVSELSYGTKLAAVILAIGPTAVSTAALPHFSMLAAARETGPLRKVLRSYAAIILIAVLPLTAVLILYSEPLVRFLFQKGAFTEAATRAVSTIQAFSFLHLPFAMMSALLARLISSLRANRALLQAAAIGFFLTIAGDYILTKAMGAAGIPLARACVASITVLYMSVALGRRIRTKT